MRGCVCRSLLVRNREEERGPFVSRPSRPVVECGRSVLFVQPRGQCQETRRGALVEIDSGAPVDAALMEARRFPRAQQRAAARTCLPPHAGARARGRRCVSHCRRMGCGEGACGVRAG
jgi:hypothetical protein